MAKWIDDLDRPDSAAEQQKLREAAKVEEYWRRHPTARFTGEFFQALSKATRDQCEELDRRFRQVLAESADMFVSPTPRSSS
jgi:TPP-dependent pyruvate/acetoin dehydrogenase alpha subunit